MAAKFRRVLRLYALYARMDWRWFTQDTACCITVMISELIASIASASGVLLLAARFEGVGDLSFDEVLWMMGFYTLADGLTNVLFGGGNVLHISRRVGRGQLDHMLIQPVPLWMQLLTEGFMPVSGASGLLVGIALTSFSAMRLSLAITPAFLLALGILLLARMATALGTSYLVASAAFYQPVACEEISSVVIDLLGQIGRFPLVGMPGGATLLLSTALPAGLMAYVPAMLLLDKMGGPIHVIALVTSAAWCALATYVFRKGLKHYAKYSVGRYREMGHR